MKGLVAFCLAVAASLSGIASAQVTVVDLNAKPRPFSAADYQTMLACSIEKQPDAARRYATYHLMRRGNQTPAQNESDPDSRLGMKALEGCFEFRNGEVIPFSFDRLIADWGKAFGVAQPMQVNSTESLAECAVKYERLQAERFIALPAGDFRAMTLVSRLAGPMCKTGGKLSLNLDVLRSELLRRLAENKPSLGGAN